MGGRQPALGLLGQDRPMSRRAAATARWSRPRPPSSWLAGCTGGDADPDGRPRRRRSPTADRRRRHRGRRAAAAPARRRLLPADLRRGGRADRDRRARSPARGRTPRRPSPSAALDTVVDGHLLAVDSDRVQRAGGAGAARTGSREFVGGTADQRRLSMLRAVWFTPDASRSPTRAPTGSAATSSRVAGDRQLAPARRGRLAGVLDDAAGGTATACAAPPSPATPGFERVICSRGAHAGGRSRTVDLRRRRLPRRGRASATPARRPARTPAGAAAEDPLDYQWGYEWPTAEQWDAGQTLRPVLGAGRG